MGGEFHEGVSRINTETFFVRATVNDVNLSQAILCRANFSGVDFKKSGFSGADMTKANLKGANLKRAYGLTRAQLQSAVMDKNTILQSYLKQKS